MKQSRMKKFAAILLVLSLFTAFAGCVGADTTVNLKRNGSAQITVDVIMDTESVTEKYGMPTNFYDAIEQDFRFSRVNGWQGEYIKTNIDGVDYIGVRRTKTVEKDQISNALNDIYGQFATVTYTDKTVFGNRTISLDMNSIHYPFTQEEQVAVLSGDSKATLTITSPVAISETNANKISDREISVDVMNVINGKEPKLSIYFKFFDFMFFVPIAAVAIVVIAAGIFVLVRVTKTKKQNEGLTSINLKQKPAKTGFAGFGGFGKGGADKGEAKPKGGMSFAKKTPKYTSTPAEETKAPVQETAPVTPAAAQATPAAQEVFQTQTPSKPAFTPRRPAPFSRTPAPAPAPEAVPEPASNEVAAPETPAPTPSLGSIFTTASTVGAAPTESSFGSSSESPAEAGTARLKSREPAETPKATYGSAKMSATGSQSSSTASYGTAKMSTASTTEQSGEAHPAYGSAKMSRGGKPDVPASGTGSLFTPRSTAPNVNYGYSDDLGLGEEKGSSSAKGEHKESSLSGLFTPRSTAPNLEYGFSDETYIEDTREKKVHQDEHKEESHSGLFVTYPGQLNEQGKAMV